MRGWISRGGWLPLLTRLPKGSRAVALTFDDGPTPETTPAILAALARSEATATFFLTGERAAKYPDLVQAIVAGGHSVYGHGWCHDDLKGEPRRALADMHRVEEVLARCRPTPQPYFIRLPFNAGFDGARMHRTFAAFAADVQFVAWSYSLRDYAIPLRCRTPDDLVQECAAAAAQLEAAASLPDSIVLLHEQPYGCATPLNAALAGVLLPMVLESLHRRALRTAPIVPAGRLPPWRNWFLTHAY